MSALGWKADMPRSLQVSALDSKRVRKRRQFMKSQYAGALALLIGVGLGAAAVQSLHAQANPPAYAIAECSPGSFCLGRLFVPLGNILKQHVPLERSYRSDVHLITQARRLGMKREDEYRHILQRASEEQSAVL